MKNSTKIRLTSGIILILMMISNFAPFMGTTSDINTQLEDQIHKNKQTSFSNYPGSQAITANEDLVARYSFDIPQKPGEDNSGNGNDAVLTDASRVFDNERGAVLSFGDIAYNSMIASSSESAETAVTIATWLKVDDNQPGNWETIFATDGTDNVQQINEIRYSFVYGRLFFDVEGSYPNSYNVIRSETVFNSDEYIDNWVHTAVVYEKIGGTGTLSYYINGKLDASYDLTTAVFCDLTDINIGSRHYSTRYDYEFYGDMDDFRIYNSALTSNEIQYIYANSTEATWWNNGTHTFNYRYELEASAELPVEDYNAIQRVNFTNQLNDMRIEGTVDVSSIKLVEYNHTTQINEECETYDFTEDAGFNAKTNATGTLNWNLNGSTGTPMDQLDIPYSDGSIRNWSVIGGPYYRWDGAYINRGEIPITDFYSPGMMTNLYTWQNYYDVDDGYIDFTDMTTNGIGATNHDNYHRSAWAMTYVYFPEDISNLNFWLYTNFRTYFIFDQQEIFYREYGLQQGDDISDTIHVFNYGSVSAGWHSILTQTDINGSVNADRYGEWGFSLNLSSSDSSIVEIPNLNITTRSDIWESRKYFVYFNITETTPDSKYDNNYYGNLNPERKNLLGGPKITVKPLNYRQHNVNKTNVIQADWWNVDWSYRLLVNISGLEGRYYNDHLIEETIDFTQVMDDAGITGIFDENSIRVIEWDEFFVVNNETPSQFDKDDDYVVENNAVGTLCWVMDGKTTNLRERYYFIYFDTKEFELKDAPDYSASSDMLLTTNIQGKDYTIENEKIRISMKEGQIIPGIDDDHIYEVYDKRSDVDLQNPSTRAGWELYSWNYGGINSENFDEITSVEVVSNGNIRSVIKMTYDSTNFIYERFYTINYLDDTVRIEHRVECKPSVSYVGYGFWEFVQDWLTTSNNTAFGMGGMNFGSDANTNFDGSQEFSSLDSYNSFYNEYTERFYEDAWYSVWDETYNNGIGTIWDPETTTGTYDTYIDHVDMGVGGLTSNLGFRPQRIYSPNSFVFTMWGHIFHDNDGSLTKIRAKGLQDPPNVKIGDAVLGGGANLQLKALDNNGQSIDGAYIHLTNNSGEDPRLKQTNSIGNITFKGLYEGTWNIDVIYTVGDVNYTIYSDSIELNTYGDTVLKFYQTLICNLTTLDLLVTDMDVNDSDYWGLYLANVTLVNATSGNHENITSFYTDTLGEIQIRLPITTWEFSVQYQGKARKFQLEETPPLEFNKTLDLSSVSSEIFNCTIGEAKTTLTINDTSTASWGSEQQIVNSPYYVNAYVEDDIGFNFYYKAISGGSIGGIVGATGNWTLISLDQGNTIVNYSLDINEDFTMASGNYNFTLYGNEYNVGSYILKLELEKVDNQKAYIDLTINFLNFTAQLELISPDENLKIVWGDNLFLEFNYTSIIPVERDISNAVLYYKISSYGIGPTLLLHDDSIPLGPTYNFTWNNIDLPVGIYTVNVYGNETNYAFADISFSIQILPRNSSLDSMINPNFRVSDTYLKGADGETITFQVNYTDGNGDYMGPEAIVSAYIEGGGSYSNLESIDLENGLYDFSINSSKYDFGEYTIKIQGQYEDAYYTTQIAYLTMDIIDFWDTSLSLITPPTIYPWGNNVSFQVRYYCTEQPRSNLYLPNAAITQLNISYLVDTVEYEYLILNSSSRGIVWDWIDQDDGKYLINFNSSIVNISSPTIFYCAPTINYSIYREATIKPYITIYPVETSISLQIGDNPLNSLELMYQETEEISAILSISDDDSGLKGKEIEGALMTYSVYNDVGNELELSGQFEDDGNGQYKFIFNHTEEIGLGNYTVRVNMNIENYTLSEIASFSLKIIPRVISVSYQGDFIEDHETISKPKGDNYIFRITLKDSSSELTITNAIVIITFEELGITLNLEHKGDGVYEAANTFENVAAFTTDKTVHGIMTIEAENYEFDPITIIVTIEREEIFTGVPVFYFLIALSAVLIIIGSIAGYRVYQKAQIPAFVKLINKLEKQISGNKEALRQNMTLTMEEEIIEKFKDEWAILDYNIENIWKNPEEAGEYKTPADNTGGS